MYNELFYNRPETKYSTPDKKGVEFVLTINIATIFGFRLIDFVFYLFDYY